MAEGVSVSKSESQAELKDQPGLGHSGNNDIKVKAGTKKNV